MNDIEYVDFCIIHIISERSFVGVEKI